jgi:membrane protein
MLLSTTFTALNNGFFREAAGPGAASLAGVLGLITFKVAAIPMLMLLLFLIYWLLPNCKISPSQIVPAAIGVGLLLEILKYVNLLTWPYLRAKLSVEYGPFYYTVTIILWGFLASMVVLAGAEWTARRAQAESAVISR